MTKKRARKAREWWVCVDSRGEFIIRKITEKYDANFKTKKEATEICRAASFPVKVCKVREVLKRKGRKGG